MIDTSIVGFTVAFVAGVVSFLSPCVLPLVPAYVSYVAGQSGVERSQAQPALARASPAVLSVFFVLGFSTVFVALGASATLLGGWLLQYRHEANLIGGAVVVFFGLLMVGLAKPLPWFQRDVRFYPALRGGHPTAAYALGLAFGFGWTPCIGPVLGAILTLTAMQSSALQGILLLASYAAGLGVPFMLAALFTGKLVGRMKEFRRVGAFLQIGAGVVMVLMGIAMITGHLTSFAFWLLKAFPVLGRIGWSAPDTTMAMFT